jgi:hypothetical protein
MNDIQRRMERIICEMKDMQQVTGVEWDENEVSGLISVLFRNTDGKQLLIPLHDPAMKDEYEADAVLLNMMLQRVFKENGINCPYHYPVNLKWLSGLVNDARKLFRMKNQGNMDEFEFEYCLPDVIKQEMVDLSLGFSEDWFGCGEDLDALAYFIEHA